MNNTLVESLHVERGCIRKQKENGLEVSFPARADFCTDTTCDKTLTEENYGNVGNIAAKYSTKVSATGFPYNSMAWSKVGMTCYQCESEPRATAESKVKLKS